jgi:hypothetical protein
MAAAEWPNGAPLRRSAAGAKTIAPSAIDGDARAAGRSYAQVALIKIDVIGY